MTALLITALLVLAAVCVYAFCQVESHRRTVRRLNAARESLRSIETFAGVRR